MASHVVARRNARKSIANRGVKKAWRDFDVMGYAKALGTDLQTTGGLLRKYRNVVGPAAIITYLLPTAVDNEAAALKSRFGLDAGANWYSTIGRSITMLTAVGLFFGASVGIPHLYKNYFPPSEEDREETETPTPTNCTLNTLPAQIKTVIPNPLIPPRTNNNPQQYIPNNVLFPIHVPI